MGAADVEADDAGAPKDRAGLDCGTDAPATEEVEVSVGFVVAPKLNPLAAGLDPKSPPEG